VTSLPSLGPRGEGWVLLQGLLLVAIFVAGLAEAPYFGPAWALLSPLGGVLIAVGGILALLGVRSLGRSLTPFPVPRDEGELVDTGVYRLVRHPIYGGLVIAALGYALMMQALLTAIAGSLTLLLFFTLKSAREEAWLVRRYPGYAAYRARTRRMLPYIY
jgi:protein-S-isoprenylcysteine O-methyltransferase Ste14